MYTVYNVHCTLYNVYHYCNSVPLSTAFYHYIYNGLTIAIEGGCIHLFPGEVMDEIPDYSARGGVGGGVVVLGVISRCQSPHPSSRPLSYITHTRNGG